jgi:hypothetical protein
MYEKWLKLPSVFEMCFVFKHKHKHNSKTQTQHIVLCLCLNTVFFRSLISLHQKARYIEFDYSKITNVESNLFRNLNEIFKVHFTSNPCIDESAGEISAITLAR